MVLHEFSRLLFALFALTEFFAEYLKFSSLTGRIIYVKGTDNDVKNRKIFTILYCL